MAERDRFKYSDSDRGRERDINTKEGKRQIRTKGIQRQTKTGTERHR